jgi:ethanolamine ammonia-lyase small subunit
MKKIHPLKLDLGLKKHTDLSKYTFARINQPKTGHSIAIPEVLSFRADHAFAKDAIFCKFETESIATQLNEVNIKTITIESKACDKTEYLKRPDLGRLVTQQGIDKLKNTTSNFDVVFIITDGLSAQGVNNYSVPSLNILIPKLQQSGYSISPVVIVKNGRVAIADIIGEELNCKLSVILIGERPGLSSPDSMGAYITYMPKQGLTDEKRNCVSNIRDKGLIVGLAAEKIFYLITESLTKKISGVNLKDNFLV